MRKVQKNKNHKEDERQTNTKWNKKVNSNEFSMKNRMHHSNIRQRNIGNMYKINMEQKQRPEKGLNEEN